MEKKDWRWRLYKLLVYIDVDCGEQELGFAIEIEDVNVDQVVYDIKRELAHPNQVDILIYRIYDDLTTGVYVEYFLIYKTKVNLEKAGR